jgi:hypothetical protein
MTPGDGRGIMRHGSLKAFLTRGLPKKVFRPLLYDRVDFVHHDFLGALKDLVRHGDGWLEDRDLRLMLFWLVVVPRNWFEQLFIPGRTVPAIFDAAENSDQGGGAECAFVSQAYALWMMQQFLQNDPVFRAQAGWEIGAVEQFTVSVYGPNNPILRYLEGYRFRFDVQPVVRDPRDWPIIYVWDIHDILISEEHGLSPLMHRWNDDLIQRLAFVDFGARYFVEQKAVFTDLANQD